ncbi:hypothetical protein CSB45_04685 [candidate division KSB3 bacterium]|uniref:Glycosyltransferase RgtA/B/C/D-like domain-containing protein n=1 Tax=candidate division KSB3 bacterium TaxID=2044937 RepID=A0A2G6E885_9BACT|nr:MAG: hypothetical protein CSB45_04685 [candidate division KSB3 bacterium]PIE30355.1 MAG: hypothetical protein CSA57_03455 [candidate division KSB3 bacterium]
MRNPDRVLEQWYWPALVLAVGFFLRFYGINWALPYVFHPDETRLLYAINDLSWGSWDTLDLNPDFFAYGSLPIYALKALNDLGHWLSQEFRQPLFGNFFFLGRVLSAVFGSLTLLVTYRFGCRFFSRRSGLLAAAFLSFTLLHIQLSHFLTVDVMLTCFVMSAMFLFGRVAEGKNPLRDYLSAGIVLGLALAVKVSALPLYGVFLVAHLLAVMRRKEFVRTQRYPVSAFWGIFLVALLLSALVFALCTPYALLDYKEFSRQLKEQSDMVWGLSQPPYVIQYEGTPAYCYPLQQLLSYSMGLPLGLLTLGGSLYLLFLTFSGSVKKFFHKISFHGPHQCHDSTILLFVWLLPVFLIVGGFKVKFLRYMLPLIPCLCLLGALAVDELLKRFPSRKGLITISVMAVIAFSAYSSLAFLSIYRHEDSRVQASRWIYKHITTGSGLLTELWEFAPLVSVDNHGPNDYHERQLNLYAPDCEQKIRTIAEQLHESEVVVLATRRVYASILRVPERYPLTSNYYKLLFDGSLGFQPVEPFTNAPVLFGITFNDDLADESFSVYDHPKTILFRKTEQLSSNELYELMMQEAPLDTASASVLLERMLRFPALEAHSMLLSNCCAEAPSVVATANVSGQWRMGLFWLLSVEFLGLLAFPLSSLSFRFLPDKGYAVSKILGLLLPCYLVWLGNHLGLFAYTRQHIFFVIGLFALFSAVIAWRYCKVLSTILATHWKMFLQYEAVFLMGIAAFTIFRAYNPDIFWSESSMDFSFVNVLNRTEQLPPPDPWISGFPLNYYYFGHYLVASLTKLTNIPPQISYNLAFGLFPAFVILETFSLLYNLTRRWLVGLLTVWVSSIAGNLDGLFLLLDMLKGKEGVYRYFRPAHEVIPFTVHEFPFWTFTFVDLHAHLLNMPFLLAVFLIGMNLFFKYRPGHRQESIPECFQTDGWLLELLLYSLLVGTLGVTSSWDYPTGVIFLILVSLLIALRQRLPLRHSWKHALRPLSILIGVIIPGSLLAFAPFYTAFSRSGMGLGLTGRATTMLSDYLTIFGAFFFSIFSYLIVKAATSCSHAHPWRTLLGLLGLTVCLYVAGSSLFLVNYTTLLLLAFTIAFGSYVIVNSANAKRTAEFSTPQSAEENTARQYIWLCLIYACLITGGCELVFVKDFLQGGDYKRMNTIFKFYIPAWFLFSCAASYSLWQVQAIFQRRTGRRKRLAVFGQKIWYAVCALFMTASLVFPVMTVWARRHQQDVYVREYLSPTLDGLAYIQVKNPEEYQAVAWLNEHVTGTPVILEASGADYLYEYARISANTGLPTVLGWQSHAEQREHWNHAHQRVQDIKTIYGSPDIRQVLRLLRSYQVQYIYIGSTERRDFTREQLQKFEQYPQYFETVFRAGETVIYRLL